MKRIGFGIIGCGMIASFHAKALMEIEGVDVVALQSRRRERAEALAQSLPQPPVVYTDVEAMLRLPGLDVVCICTASGAHLEPAMAAARAGKHVIVEKPLEVTLERCDALIEACRQSGVRLGAIFPSRFADANRALKEAVSLGRFGRLTMGVTACPWWRTQAYYDEGGWKGTLALDGGGALMNQAIHNVDLLLWLMGDAASVMAMTATLAHERIEVEDTAAACVQFQSGALGIIQAATSAYPGWPKTIALHGDRGSALVEQEDVLRWDFAEPRPEDEALRARFAHKAAASGGASHPAAISHEYHRRQLEDFVQSLRTGKPLAVDGAEGRKAVALIVAIYESARTGQRVALA